MQSSLVLEYDRGNIKKFFMSSVPKRTRYLFKSIETKIMKGNNNMKNETTTIFALVRSYKLYIGKTRGRRISAVYSRHRCGEHAATCKHFAKPAPSPDLHILVRQEMKYCEAYKYVLAYIQAFCEAGYEILNHPRSIERSNDLKEDTQMIYNEIKTKNVSELLQSTRVSKVTDADIQLKEEDAANKKEKSDYQLTIRLTKRERDHFRQLSEDLHLNQHQTLLYLFDKCEKTDPVFLDFTGDSYLRVLFDCQKEEIERLKKEKQLLLEKFITSRDDKSKQLAVERKAFADVKAGIASYFALMKNATPIPLEIEYGLYRNTEDVDKFEYPENAGVYLFRPQMVLRGKGRYSALFIMGFDEKNNRYLKFRYYPKSNYVGIPIPDSTFSVRGAKWLVGCRAAKDCAMDLYCSFPVNICPKNF